MSIDRTGSSEELVPLISGSRVDVELEVCGSLGLIHMPVDTGTGRSRFILVGILDLILVRSKGIYLAGFKILADNIGSSSALSAAALLVDSESGI
jgi:hypothetical protein